MPTEKFYNPTVVEGETPPVATGLVFAVAWGPTIQHRGQSAVSVAGVPLDESGVTRLIAALRRAKRQAFAASA